MSDGRGGLTAPERSTVLACACCVLIATAGASIKPAPANPRTRRVLVSSAAAEPVPPPPPDVPSVVQDVPEGSLTGLAVTRRPTTVRRAPSGSSPAATRIRAGIPLPITGRAGGYLAVLTPCQVTGWVTASDVRVQAPAGRTRLGRGMALGEAVLVLDAGHGGGARGARGPGGFEEKEANLAIVKELAALLARPLGDGDAPRVVLARDGDYEAGLAYRAAVAGSVRAHALLSIHNNSEPDGPSQAPGTETYYQQRSPGSKRLAGLAYEEVARALRSFPGIAWVAERDAGAKYRRSASGADYYGLLRRSQVPASIVEVAFISNTPEEELLRRADARQAVAAALYRALVRYVTTDDPGSGFVEPYPRQGGLSGRVRSDCVDPG